MKNFIELIKNRSDINVKIESDNKAFYFSFCNLYNEFKLKSDLYKYINQSNKFIKINNYFFIKKEYGINNIKKIKNKIVVDIWEYTSKSFGLENIINDVIKKEKFKQTEINDYVIIEIQTTGIDIQDKILSIALIDVRNNEIYKKYKFYIDPKLTKDEIENYTKIQEFSNKSAYSISKISVPGMDNPSDFNFINEKDAVINIFKIIKNRIIVGHNLAFEVKMINSLFKRNKIKEENLINNLIKGKICILKLLKKHKRKTSIEELIKIYNIESYNRKEYHDAFLDALIIFKIIKISSILQK